MISETSLLSKIAKWAKTPEGKARTKAYVNGLAASGGKTASGKAVMGPEQMEEAARLFIEVLREELPDPIKSLGSSLYYTKPYKAHDGTYEVAICFLEKELHRESLYDEEYPDGIENIVALLNNGMHAKDYVYGSWDNRKPTGGLDLRGDILSGQFAYVRSKKDRDPLFFMQYAVQKFEAKYGEKYGVIQIKLNSDYTEDNKWKLGG